MKKRRRLRPSFVRQFDLQFDVVPELVENRRLGDAGVKRALEMDEIPCLGEEG
jgi:hypothetical protein